MNASHNNRTYSKVARFLTRHGALLAILGLSFVLRWALVTGGGQYFWPDEQRFTRSEAFVNALTAGDWTKTAHVLVDNADHTGFTVIGSVAVVIRNLFVQFSALKPYIDSAAWLQAGLLSFASVISIGLIYGIARKSGASELESQLAAFLAAASNALFYFARHLFPYDSALALLLGGLWIGWTRERSTFGRSFAAGLLIGCGFLTYNGYWLLAALIGLLCIGLGERSMREITLRAVSVGVGALLPLGGLLLLATALNVPYLKNLTDFGTTALQGDFNEGWSLPFVYLWQTEGGLLIVWIVGAALAIGLTVKRGVGWFALAVIILIALAVLSTVLHKSVVYGRLVRQVVPFLCMTAAAGLTTFSQTYRPALLWQRLFLVGIIGIAALNFAPPLLMRRFPVDALNHAIADYGSVNRAYSAGIFHPAPEPTWPFAQVEILNPGFIHPFEARITPPDGVMLSQSPYPLSYPPYQFEGMTPIERRLINSTDVSVKVIKLTIQPVTAQIDTGLELYAFNPPQDSRASQCEVLHVDLWWHTLRSLTQTETVTLRLDNGSTQIASTYPLIGPGRHWNVPDDRWVDQYYWPILCDLPVGKYTLRVMVEGASGAYQGVALTTIQIDPASVH